MARRRIKSEITYNPLIRNRVGPRLIAFQYVIEVIITFPVTQPVPATPADVLFATGMAGKGLLRSVRINHLKERRHFYLLVDLLFENLLLKLTTSIFFSIFYDRTVFFSIFYDRTVFFIKCLLKIDQFYNIIAYFFTNRNPVFSLK